MRLNYASSRMLLLYIWFGRDGRFHEHKPLVFIIHLIWHGSANSQTQTSWFPQLPWCRLRYMVTEYAKHCCPVLLWRLSGPQSLVMLPAKMGDSVIITRQSTNQKRVFHMFNHMYNNMIGFPACLLDLIILQTIIVMIYIDWYVICFIIVLLRGSVIQ